MKCPQVSAPIKVELKMNQNLTEYEKNEMIIFADNFVNLKQKLISNVLVDNYTENVVNLKQKLSSPILDRFVDIVGFGLF